MNFWLIILVAQAAFLLVQFGLSIAASVRERGEDSSFAGDKVAFRS